MNNLHFECSPYIIVYCSDNERHYAIENIWGNILGLKQIPLDEVDCILILHGHLYPHIVDKIGKDKLVDVVVNMGTFHY